jgi:broad-specificity NMP kinase
VLFFKYFLIVVAGGPSGSGKTSLAHKMANIVGCEVVSLENYFKSELVKDFKYDDFSSLDLSLLSKVGWHNIIHLMEIFCRLIILLFVLSGLVRLLGNVSWSTEFE